MELPTLAQRIRPALETVERRIVREDYRRPTWIAARLSDHSTLRLLCASASSAIAVYRAIQQQDPESLIVSKPSALDAELTR